VIAELGRAQELPDARAADAQLRVAEDPSMVGSTVSFGRHVETSARSGTVKVEGFETGERAFARGSFELDFDGEPVTGHLFATPCPP
jgi:hypothetical protein